MAIIISSGYRCPALNKAVGGSANFCSHVGLCD
ncbi:D-Ala-D-Ala carboxypeptidase family metallohydrolase [Moraxella catarrhalis]|nr:D-Ala-D-Ala carboxypeptidase family metallohydrolase [Moraxella catarrhalis]